MTRVLVTGGTGVLGRELVKLLRDDRHTVRVMSRRPQPASLPSHTEWAQVELETGKGLADAVQDVEVIYHAASSPFRHSQQVDVDGTQRLLEAARQVNVAHFIYISIVGIECIPFSYYRNKVTAEKLIADSGVPWTNLRATQFHNLLDFLFRVTSRFPIMFLPTNFQFQPVGVTEVVQRLVACIEQGPAGRLTDMGGPEVLRLGDLARIWLQARKMKRLIAYLPLPGKTADGFRRGLMTCPNCDQGSVTWMEWVNRTYCKGG